MKRKKKDSGKTVKNGIFNLEKRKSKGKKEKGGFILDLNSL